MIAKETYTVISSAAMERAESVQFITLQPDLSGRAGTFTAFALPCWTEKGILLHMHANAPGTPRTGDRLECRIIQDVNGEEIVFSVSPSGDLSVSDGSAEQFRLYMEEVQGGEWGAYWVMPADLLRRAVPDLEMEKEAVIGIRFSAVSLAADGSETVLTWPGSEGTETDSAFGLLILGD